MSARLRQEGATLLVTLVMLVAVTLLAIAGIKMGGASLLAVGNMQARKFTEGYANVAIEHVMNSILPFNNPTNAISTSTATTGSDPYTIYAVPAGVTISVSSRSCVFTAPASGYSAVSPIVPEDNVWEFQVAVTDSFTSATARMTQGVKIRQVTGSCT